MLNKMIYKTQIELLVKDDKFRYNFNLNSDVIKGFVQGQFKYNKIDFYGAANFSQTNIKEKVCIKMVDFQIVP